MDARLLRDRDLLLRQLRHSGTSPAVLGAMTAVPRELFVPPPLRHRAYEDCALPIGAGQTISQPRIVAVMVGALGLVGDERVLEVGAGSGYQAAVLSRLAREVIAVERIDALRLRAASVLTDAGCQNVRIEAASEDLGSKHLAPFDAIIVAAAAPHVPRVLLAQLRPGGRMVLPVGTRDAQHVVRVTLRDNAVELAQFGGCVFVPLIGAGAWPAERAGGR